MSEFWQWASTIPWFAWVAIIAILGGSATAITKSIASHREKMEAIRQGDPARRD